MTLTDPQVLKALLIRHGLSPTKKWGQHFLVSRSVVDRILAESAVFQGVLEIGPGPGILTRELSSRCPVVAVEIDPVAVSALRESAPSATVIHADALEIDLSALVADLPAPRGIVSNMPYNITGPLLSRFCGLRHLVVGAVLMMQAEVGKKILAQKGDSDAGSLSMVMQTLFDISKVVNVPPGGFFPPPKVDSIVLKLVPRDSGLGEREESFLSFVRAGFKQPRKTIVNNLQSRFPKDRVGDALERLALPTTVRPHQLGRDAWIDLFNSLQ